MRIALFNPPVHHYAGVHYRLNPPLGLPILAAVLERAGHSVGVWDLEALLISPAKLVLSLGEREHWPDAVGFTCTTHAARGVRECIAALRDAHYGGYIAVGGPHVSVAPDEVLGWGADAAVVGEAEGNVTEIFELRQHGIVRGKAMAIENIPGPLWQVHHPQPVEYGGNQPPLAMPEGIAMWSRGCPHDCIFCANPVFGHQRIRYRPAEAIYQDMAALRDLGCRGVFVYDDELVGHGGGQNEWLMTACARIAPLGLLWKCQGRCSERNNTRDVLQAMYDAGCRAVMWGVESFSNRVLQAIHKATTEDDIWHTLRLSHEVGIGNWVFLMVGNYQETARDLAYTEKRLRQACGEGLVQWRQVTVCTPVRGTRLYEYAAKEGWLAEQPETGPQMAQVYNATPWLTQRELRYWKARLEGIA